MAGFCNRLYPDFGLLMAEIARLKKPDFSLYLDYIYPIGSIYQTTNAAFNPEEVFTGKWERLEDVFLLAAGVNHDVGDTGGSETVNLTVENMPKHNHNVLSGAGNNSKVYGLSPYQTPGDVSGDNYYLKYDGSTNEQFNYITTDSSGSGIPHNNMPPYLTVIMWVRVE